MTKSGKRLVIISALILSIIPKAFATADAVDAVAFYYGEVQMTAPDGRAIGKTVSLAKRSILPSQGRIVESVIQPGRRPGEPAREIVTTMSRVGGSTTFTAQDSDQSFSGTLIFEGAEWSWEKWRYDILLKDGSKLQGEGRLDQSGVHTSKKLLTPQGSVKLEEHLLPISETEYLTRRRALLGS